MIEKIKHTIADIFEVPLAQVDNISYGQHKNWDSMRHFLLILALEELWGKEIDEKTASTLKSLTDIMKYYDDLFN